MKFHRTATPTVLLASLLACDTSHINLERGDADRPPAVWKLETIGPADRIGAVTDFDGQPRVALESSRGVEIARRGANGWIVSDAIATDRARVAFSYDGSAHVLGRDRELVRHALWDLADGWTSRDVGRFDQVLALTVDGFGTVLGLLGARKTISVAELGQEAAAWSQRRVPGAPPDPSASVTTSGSALLAAFASEGGIDLFRRDEAWQQTRVPAPNVRDVPAVAATEDGSIWLLYRDTVDGALRAMRGEPGAPWRHELVDWGEGVGAHPSLVVEADGRAHACYFAGDQVRYALREPHDPWATSTVGAGAADRGCDLALDRAGGVHVAFVRAAPEGTRAWHASVEVPAKLALTRRTVADAMPVARRRLSAQELGTVPGVRQVLVAPDGGSLAAVGKDLAIIGSKRGRVRAELSDALVACQRRAERVTLGLAIDEAVEELARLDGEAERPRVSDDGGHLTVYLGAEVTMPAADAKPPLGDPLTVHRFATIDTSKSGRARTFAVEVRGFTDDPVHTGSGEYVAWADVNDRSRIVIWSREAGRIVHTLSHPAEVSGVQILDDRHIACQWSDERTLVHAHDLESGAPIWEVAAGLPLALLSGTNLGMSAGEVIHLDDGTVTMTAPEPPEEDGPERLSGLWALASDGRTAIGPTSEGNWAVGNATNARVRRILDTELDGRFHLGGHTGLQWRFARGRKRAVAATLEEIGVFDIERGKLVRALNVGALGSVVAILLAGDDRAVFLRRVSGTTTVSALHFGLDRLRKTRDPVAKLMTAAPWLAATPLAATGQFVGVQVPGSAKAGQCLLELETLALDAACVDDHGARVPRRPGVACAIALAASDDLMFEVTLFDNNGLRARAVRDGLKGWVAPTAWLPIAGKATSMALSADGNLVVVGDSAGNLLAGAPRSLAHQGTIKRTGKPASCPSVTQPDGVSAVAVPAALPVAAAGYGDGQLFLYNLTTGDRIGEHRFPCDAPTALAFDAAGTTLYVGTSKGRVVRLAIEPL